MQALAVPGIRYGEVEIPDGVYHPSELGIYVEEVGSISVGRLCGRCKGSSSWYRPMHADVANIKKPHLHFDDGRYIFDKHQRLSDGFIHEYCHALRGWDPKWEEHVSQEIVHDAEWAALMKYFGLKPERSLQWVQNE